MTNDQRVQWSVEENLDQCEERQQANSRKKLCKTIRIAQMMLVFKLVTSIIIPQIMIINLINSVDSMRVDHCYSDIGCFPLSSEFYHPRHRPFNVRPWHRKRIKTKFLLFNSHYPAGLGFELKAWNYLNLIGSKFNPNWETKIIIPGWLDNIKRALWVREMKDSLLWHWQKPLNIIVVHWINFTPYTIATANTRVVGAELANLLKFIELEHSYNRSYYHLIGHSLGAHISGYCGDRIPGLGRITALDPARPFFQHMPKSVRLDRKDAKFVDAIHSDFTPENAIFFIMSFGMTTPVGHVDFYPNGPPLLQSGCLRDTILSIQRGIGKGISHNSLSVAFLESVRYLTACDHQRSHQWFIESILNRECLFVGVRCNEYEGLINGRCTCDNSNSACAIMGIHADQMYLNNYHEEMFVRRPETNQYNHFSSSLLKNKDQIYSQLKQEALFLRDPSSVDHYQKANLISFEDSLNLPLMDIEQNDFMFNEYLRETFLLKKRQDQQKMDFHDGLEPFDSFKTINAGHQIAMSDYDRDIEDWYENNSRWHLKTDSREKFCVNQYQVLIFFGALRTTSGLDKLKANLIVSIIGSRGQILNQKFKPRSEILDSNTMQPFFIILEGSYSLGEIHSLAIGWERSFKRDPIEATISFESNLLQQMQPMMLTYKSKHPWLSETLKYDYSRASIWNQDHNPNEIRKFSKRNSLQRNMKRLSDKNNLTASDLDNENLSSSFLLNNNNNNNNNQKEDDSIDNTLVQDELSALQAIDHRQQEVISDETEFQFEPTISAKLDDLKSRISFDVDDVDIPKPYLNENNIITTSTASQANKILDNVNLRLHNIGIHQFDQMEDSIVIKQVVISPIQAYYGKYTSGKRIAKTFCPPKLGLKLYREQTIKFVRNFSGKCNHKPF